MTPRERYLARQRRYNASEKGLARYRAYWHRTGLGLRRERLNERDQAVIDELIALHPWLREIV